MNDDRNGIAGFRLTQHTWVTELGSWIDAITPDGRRAGALLFDSKIIALPGVRDRVVAAVMADQRLVQSGMGGLIPVADVVAAGEQVWLLTDQAVSPTLSDLLGMGVVDPGGAAAVLVETAQTLLALHSAGLAHGSVHPGTVIIGVDGAALLSERGLADAVRGQAPAFDRDTMAWAALARGLAATAAGGPATAGGRAAAGGPGVAGGRGAAELFERAALAASTRGLVAARDTLLSGREALPGGLISRDRLAQAARGRSAFAAPPQRAVERDEGDIVTLLHVPGRTNPNQQPMHFGPGVATEPPQLGTTAERIWREGREQIPTRRAGSRLAKAARARRRRTIIAAVIFAIIMAGAILVWIKYSGAPALAVKSINVVAPKKTQGCDSTVVVNGTIVTNGTSGEVAYEWHKNLDKEVVKQTLRVSSGQSTYTVPLRWTLKGKSSVKATATLRVTSPGPQLDDKATFTYKC